jgi:type IV pilus assembly protein PilA
LASDFLATSSAQVKCAKSLILLPVILALLPESIVRNRYGRLLAVILVTEGRRFWPKRGTMNFKRYYEFSEEISTMRKQKGFSLIELLIVVAIILIIAAIAIPSLLRSRIAANDSAAASTLRTLNTAEVSYLSAYPTAGYSQSLTSLGPNGAVCTTAASVTSTTACLIDEVVGCAAAAGPCPKGGYNYYVTGDAAVGGVLPDYVVSAGPLNLGTSGSKDFCSMPDAVIRQTKPGTAPVVLAAAVDIPTCSTIANYTSIAN